MMCEGIGLIISPKSVSAVATTEGMTVADVDTATMVQIAARSKFFYDDPYTSTQTRTGMSLSKSYEPVRPTSQITL